MMTGRSRTATKRHFVWNGLTDGPLGSFRFELTGDLIRRMTQPLNSRTTHTVVRFRSAFSLPDFEAPQPPGEYLVNHDEEQIDIGSHQAWRRVATFIHLPAISSTDPVQQMVRIDPDFLNAALKKDKEDRVR